MKVAIYGGTFDPIHVGHLISVEYVKQELDFDLVLFVPAQVPPNKKDKSIIDAYHRLAMLELALIGHDNFFVWDYEVAAETKLSYTWFTIQAAQIKYPNAQLFLLMGADNINDFHNWKYTKQIIKNCQLVSFNKEQSVSIDNNWYKNNILFVETPIIAISSSMIRERIEKKLSIKYMLPQPVLDYIKEHKLYEKSD